MDRSYRRQQASNDWESSFSHILQRTRHNLDKIAVRPSYESHDHNLSRSYAYQPSNEIIEAPRASSPGRIFETNENSFHDNVNRAHDMSHSQQISGHGHRSAEKAPVNSVLVEDIEEKREKCAE